MAERSADWINQAKRDLRSAEKMLEDEIFEWSCFVSQQAAEKAVKAVIQRLNAVSWGHSVFDLIKVLSKKFRVPRRVLTSSGVVIPGGISVVIFILGGSFAQPTLAAITTATITTVIIFFISALLSC